MKLLHCHNLARLGKYSQFVFFSGGPETYFQETESAMKKAAEGAENLKQAEYKSADQDRAAFKKRIDDDIKARKTDIDGKISKIDEEIKRLESSDEKDKDKKIQTLKGLRAEREKELKGLSSYRTELEGKAEATISRIEAAYKARHAEIQKEAEKYKNSIALEMEVYDVEQRQHHPNHEDEGNWAIMKDRVENYGLEEGGLGKWNFQKGVAMQQFDESGADTKRTEDWDQAEQVEMVTEAIQTIYEEQGKDAADEMMQNIRDNKGEGKINWFTFNSAFRGSKYMNVDGEDSVFKYVHTNMGAPVDKPKTFGHILGKMYSADKYFSGKDAPGAFKAYQAYVQNEMTNYAKMDLINKGENEKDILSPKQWLKEHGKPEHLEEVMENPEKDRQKFLDDLLSSIEVPENGEPRLSLIRATVEGALWASNDPAEWNGIARKVLAKMMGGEFDAQKMNMKDIDVNGVVNAHMKDIADESSRWMIGDIGMSYVASLIEGAEIKYADSDPEFLKDYKKMIKEKFGRDSDLMKQIRDEVTKMGGGEDALRTNWQAQKRIKDILDRKIRAAYNYRNDLIDKWRRSGKHWEEATEKNRTLSNELYDQAMKKFKKGDFDEALYLFHKSYGTAKSPSSLILIAQTYDKMGDKKMAKAAASGAVDRAQRLVKNAPSEENLVILRNAESFAEKQGVKVEKRESPAKKAVAEADKVLLVMTDHTASRTSPTQYRQAVSLKAAYEKAEDKKAWLESNREQLDSLKKRMPKVLGWEKGLGIERKETGEVEKDPTNAKPTQFPAGQPKAAPKEGGEDKGLEEFGTEKPIEVAKAEGVEKGDALKDQEVPKPIKEEVDKKKGDLEPGLYVAKRGEEQVVVEIKKDDKEKKPGYFKPNETAS